jgi:DNA polymerase
MSAYGNFKKRILNIGKAPDEIDDEKGRPFQGRAGRRLQQEYKRLGIDIFEDCLNINAVNCMVLDKEDLPREPTQQEIACCRNRVLKIIAEYQPHIIILFGTAAVTSLIGHRWKKDLGGIMKWRGWNIPDREFKARICPVFSPEYVEKADSPEIDVIWKNDLKQAISMLKKPFPIFEDEEKYVEIIEAKDFMQSSLYPAPEIAAFDYEASGLKLHAPGHRVVCSSVCANEKHVQVFMIPQKRSELKPFLGFLTNPKIKKMAHNIKYEHAASLVRLKVEVQGWYWDSMLAAHILDNRPGVTGLKFQTYVYFGVVDYDSEVSEYLHSNGSKSGNAFNKILEMIKDPVKRQKLMIYCGLDSLYEFRLAKMQQEVIYGG